MRPCMDSDDQIVKATQQSSGQWRDWTELESSTVLQHIDSECLRVLIATLAYTAISRLYRLLYSTSAAPDR